MKTEKFIYDEGYGCGPRELEDVGITVDEAIEELKKLSSKGFGNRLLYDGLSNEAMSEVGIKFISYREEELPYIE